MAPQYTAPSALDTLHALRPQRTEGVDVIVATLVCGRKTWAPAGGATVVVLALASSRGGSYEDGAVGPAIAL